MIPKSKTGGVLKLVMNNPLVSLLVSLPISHIPETGMSLLFQAKKSPYDAWEDMDLGVRHVQRRVFRWVCFHLNPPHQAAGSKWESSRAPGSLNQMPNGFPWAKKGHLMASSCGWLTRSFSREVGIRVPFFL